MSYFSMISANSLLAKGKIPNVTNTSKGVSAGFGRFDPLFEIYEFPVQVELINSKNVSITPWEINETPVVYEAVQHNGSKQTIHCNITELEFQVAPFIHLFCFHKINELIKNNKVFQFFDDITNTEVNIFPKSEYKG